MIQLNLLPDVKMQYIKAQRMRRLILSVAIIAAGASVALLLLMLGVNGLQKKRIHDLTADIKTESRELAKKPQVAKVLTVQNQLNALTGLHDQKPAVTRVFEYLNQLTPAKVDITSFDIDYTEQTANITGSADALADVNAYVDTLKFTTFQVGSEKSKSSAFSDVVLTSFGVTGAAVKNSRPANYTISFKYDQSIFDVTQDVKLVIPNKTTTRSEIDQPSALFQAAPAETAGGSN